MFWVCANFYRCEGLRVESGNTCNGVPYDSTPSRGQAEGSCLFINFSCTWYLVEIERVLDLGRFSPMFIQTQKLENWPKPLGLRLAKQKLEKDRHKTTVPASPTFNLNHTNSLTASASFLAFWALEHFNLKRVSLLRVAAGTNEPVCKMPDQTPDDSTTIQSTTIQIHQHLHLFQRCSSHQSSGPPRFQPRRRGRAGQAVGVHRLSGARLLGSKVHPRQPRIQRVCGTALRQTKGSLRGQCGPVCWFWYH